MVAYVPERLVIALVVLYVIHHGGLSVTLFEVDTQWVLGKEHAPVASPSLVVVEPEVLRVAASEIVGMRRLVGAAIALTSGHQVTASLMLAAVGRLMWHLLVFPL